jgi:hypothetical protein
MPEQQVILYRRSVDFCVWTLEVDGMRVAPFYRHGDGTGALRAAGMQPDGWRIWLSALIEEERRELEYLRQLDVRRAQAAADLDRVRPAPGHSVGRVEALLKTGRFFGKVIRDLNSVPAPPSTTPPQLWSGEPEVGACLRELWGTFTKLRGPAGRRMVQTYTPALHRLLQSPEYEAWSRDLLIQSGENTIPPCFFRVHYDGPLVYHAGPSAAVLAVLGWDAAPHIMIRRLRTAADAGPG